MTLLIDTHTLIWVLEDSPRIFGPAARAIRNLDNITYISIVSGWEMAIKVASGKSRLPIPLQDIFPGHLETLRIDIFPIQPRHLHRLLELPRHHGAPFDRLIATQALSEDLTLVGCDAAFDAYGVRRLW